MSLIEENYYKAATLAKSMRDRRVAIPHVKINSAGAIQPRNHAAIFVSRCRFGP